MKEKAVNNNDVLQLEKSHTHTIFTVFVLKEDNGFHTALFNRRQ